MRVLPDKLTTEQIDGRSIVRDEAGYLVDPNDWDEDIARHIAMEEGVTLSEEHWAVLRFMRDFLEQKGVAADARFVFRFLAATHGESQSEANRRFFSLFPYGYVKQACKIAGMRQPRAWSTG